MKNKFLNYKFFLQISCVMLGLALSVLWLLCGSGDAILLGIFFLIVYVSAGVAFLICEPIYYVIDEDGIWISTLFQKEMYRWNDITSIAVGYDAMFKFLFIKDYIIHTKRPSRYVKRKECIVKCKASTCLISQYSDFV